MKRKNYRLCVRLFHATVFACHLFGQSAFAGEQNHPEQVQSEQVQSEQVKSEQVQREQVQPEQIQCEPNPREDIFGSTNNSTRPENPGVLKWRKLQVSFSTSKGWSIALIPPEVVPSTEESSPRPLNDDIVIDHKIPSSYSIEELFAGRQSVYRGIDAETNF